MLRKLSLLGLPVSFLLSACAGVMEKTEDDWRKSGSDQEKLANLVALVPGANHWMVEMGERYKNLYWAARQEKWEFAAYQVEEIEKLAQTLSLARPGRAESAQIFLNKSFPMLHEAAASRDWQRFEPAFQRLNAECMACHVREDHAFVVIPLEPKSAASPVLDLP